ncbi:hypothetical protein HETIRDRAFT_431469 [Heterobasidion irregulare TC 32-1]|uniref:Uncharacterized protein n=1 Tax=Heterobasidion irregulare (strain TC 32-1) TaxID=747525 RepID=W4KML4_HETIT|nr:uncharacterized protein HETIRDRAFT_431469 [Heterobasidion irregulare TC 32-1]ETW86944.1 hypothetical protein HETIRDRAFT_431469 [Heterobasidion irregulare TC 32-1]
MQVGNMELNSQYPQRSDKAWNNYFTRRKKDILKHVKRYQRRSEKRSAQNRNGPIKRRFSPEYFSAHDAKRLKTDCNTDA